MTVSSIQLFNIIKDRIGEHEAQAMVEYIETKVDDKIHEKADNLATKTDLAELKAEIISWMFIFWSSTIVTLAGIIIAIFKFFPGK